MTADNLALFARSLRPTGKILLREPMSVGGSPLATRLMLAGFINVETKLVDGVNQVCAGYIHFCLWLQASASVVFDINTLRAQTPLQTTHTHTRSHSLCVDLQATAMKPGYEVGSSARLLSFAKPVAADPAPAGAADVSSVWQVRTLCVAKKKKKNCVVGVAGSCNACVASD